MDARKGPLGLWLLGVSLPMAPRFSAPEPRPLSYGLLPDKCHRNSKAANSQEISYPSDKQLCPSGLPELSLELHCIQDTSSGPLVLPQSCLPNSRQSRIWNDVSSSFSWSPPYSLLADVFHHNFLAYLISSWHLLLGGSILALDYWPRAWYLTEWAAPCRNKLYPSQIQ